MTDPRSQHIHCRQARIWQYRKECKKPVEQIDENARYPKYGGAFLLQSLSSFHHPTISNRDNHYPMYNVQRIVYLLSYRIPSLKKTSCRSQSRLYNKIDRFVSIFFPLTITFPLEWACDLKEETGF